MTRRDGLALLILTVVLVGATAVYLQHLLAITGGQLGAPLDDAWIHFQFARNLAQGQGFSFNAGDPQPGSTAPLWTLLLAGVGLFTEQFLGPAIVLSWFFLLATVWLSYGLTRRLADGRFAAFLAGLGVALDGRLLWAGLSGMEATAFAALSVAAVWLYGRDGYLRPGTALLFALAGQVRPEGHALFALAVLDSAYALLHTNWRWRSLRPLLLPMLIYGVVALPYTLFSLSVTGRPLPNTFYAKVGSEHFFSLRTLRETMGLHWGDNPLTMALLLVGLGPAWRRSRLVVLWLLGLWLLTPVIVDQVWHHGRYTMPLIPFQMVVAGVGAQWLLQQGQKRLSPPLNRWLPVGLLLLLLLGAGWRFGYWRDMLAYNANEILQIDVALGEWLAANTPEDALIAIDDIGAIAFLSQRRIVDMNGLVSPEVWPAVRQPVGLPRDTRLTRILAQSQPDYVVAFPLWHYELTGNRDVLTPLHRVETGTHSIIFQPEAWVYAAQWPFVAQATPTQPTDAVFGAAVVLRGYDWAVDEAATAVDLTLYWESLAPLTADYTLFVHLLDEAGQIVAQADGPPLNGLTPTSQWQPGDVLRQPVTVALPPDWTADAVAEVRLGWYLPESGERLAAVGVDADANAAVLP